MRVSMARFSPRDFSSFARADARDAARDDADSIAAAAALDAAYRPAADDANAAICPIFTLLPRRSSSRFHGRGRRMTYFALASLCVAADMKHDAAEFRDGWRDD